MRNPLTKTAFSILVIGIIFALATILVNLRVDTPSVGPAPTQAYGSSTGPMPPVGANIFVSLAKKAVPSVVNISTLSTVKGSHGQLAPEDFFRRFFDDYFRQHGGGGGRGYPSGPRGDDEGDGEGQDQDESPHGRGGPGDPRLPGNPGGPGGKGQRAMSLGSGFIIEPGLILTNNHVVAEADEIKVYFTEETDEKPADGEVVGRDPELDLALIKVKSKREMVPMTLGDSDALEVGEYVLAVGNPFGQGHSVTHGIISAKGRASPDFPLTKYLQTDAPINPGNSGGPLVNLKGEVIGINNAIDQRAQGIGFAIPISVVKQVLPQLKTKGVVARGYIGVLVEPVTPDLAAQIGVSKETTAPFVTHVYPGEPADKAGIKPYDVILEFGGKPVKSHTDLITGVTAVKVGDTVPVKVSRGGKLLDLKITVAQRPGAQQLAKQHQEPEKKSKKKPSAETGMALENITPEVAAELGLPEKTKGIFVNSTAYGGPADRAGILRGDVILEVNRKPINTVDDFYSVVDSPKKSYLVRIRRTDPQGGEFFSVVVLDLTQGSKK